MDIDERMKGMMTMGKCTIDHTLADVQEKLESQRSFLPQDLFEQLSAFLTDDLSQEKLNDAFHLLKKYDLVSVEEREERNTKISRFITES